MARKSVKDQLVASLAKTTTTVQQVGGTHYKKVRAKCPACAEPIQHWDYAAGLPYLDGQISRYIDRHQEKDGFQAFLKSLSYWEKAALNYYPEEYRDWLAQRGIPSVMGVK